MNGWVWEGNGLNLNGEVCGDPVGSTDPEVSRISHPCTMWRAKRPLLPILALNARLLPISGV